MEEGGFTKVSAAGFTGRMRSDLASGFTASRLAQFQEELRGEKVKQLAAGRHRVLMLPIDLDGSEVFLAVKAFGKQPAWKDRYDHGRGTKAARSFRAAEFLARHGVGTPEPLAYFDRWEGKRLVESYYLSAYVDSLTSFKDELIRIYEERPECDRLVSLLKHVGGAMRRMHDAGFYHRDLGNQNMELKKSVGNTWGEVQFIDLNRGRIRDELTIAERAIDFSRIKLPGAFFDVLVKIYWQGTPPKEFRERLKRLRMAFRLRQWSYRLRHPFRKKKKGGAASYPEVQDIWIWDSQSAQASITMDRKERKGHCKNGKVLSAAKGVLRSGRKVWKEYQTLLPQAYQKRVELEGCFGVALESTDLDFEKQREFLRGLGKIPVLIRFCHHEGMEQWKVGVAQVRSLAEAGHEVMIAMVQDRKAVTDSDSWVLFLNFVLSEVGSIVKQVELCHVVNRVKWGVHGTEDLRALLAPLKELQEKFPKVCFTGPACIDFEYHFVLSALDEIPEGLTYGALSHHLYVDRRGAPENRQGKFSTLEKCGLLRAITHCAPQCEDRVIVSEVNWPVKGSGIWSPVSATYVNPDAPEHPLNVSEQDYGYFMLRYLVIAVCSGFVDQVFWWRLVSHGFGLVDERSESGWRARPGYQMLVHFLRLLGSATFVEKLKTENEVYALRFEREESEIVMLWCNGREFSGPFPFSAERVFDVFGKEIKLEKVGESPVYAVISS